MGPYSLLILAGPESMELEVMGAAYACTALGWRTTIVAPSLGGLHGRHGLPIPGDIALGRLVPDAYTALIVPGGAPRDAEALALIARFAREADTRLLAPTTAGLESVRAVPELASLAAASKDEGIHLDGNRLTAARTGDLPALCHALDAVAKDRWPR